MNQPSSQRGGTALPHFQSQTKVGKPRVLRHIVLPSVVLGAGGVAWHLDVLPSRVHDYPMWALSIGSLLVVWALVHIGRLVWRQTAHPGDDRNAVIRRRLFGRNKRL
jgi:hypothetical protein